MPLANNTTKQLQTLAYTHFESKKNKKQKHIITSVCKLGAVPIEAVIVFFIFLTRDF